MALQVLRIVDQGRRFAKLVGNFAMAIEKLVKSRQVPVRDVIALDSLPVLRGRSLDSLPVLRRRSLRGRRLRVRGTRETQRCHHRRTENESYFGIVVACSSHLPPVLGVRCDAQAVKLFDFADLHLILRTYLVIHRFARGISLRQIPYRRKS
jgi:hypothetical protein